MNLTDWVPPTLTRDYFPRRDAPPPQRQEVAYYRRVGWSRTVRGIRVKRMRKIKWLGVKGLIEATVKNPRDVFPIEANEELPHVYKVRSQRTREKYIVKWKGKCTNSKCSCKDWSWNQVCKHIRAVRRHRKTTKKYLKEEDKDAFEDENLDNTFSEEEDQVLNEAEQLQGQILGLRWGQEY